MALIHHTTLTPTKLELLAEWLPGRPWFAGGAAEPVLDRAGGYRLDDPRGEIGIEFVVVTDASGPQPAAYQVPFTYRAAPLDAADHALIGTTEHGVLGKRYVYDGAHDPVLVGRLYALMCGATQAQAQRESNTLDPTVTTDRTGGPLPHAALEDATPRDSGLVAAERPQGAETPVPAGGEALTLRIHRVLRARPGRPGFAQRGHGGGRGVRLRARPGHRGVPDGSAVRGAFAAVVRA